MDESVIIALISAIPPVAAVVAGAMSKRWRTVFEAMFKRSGKNDRIVDEDGNVVVVPADGNGGA